MSYRLVEQTGVQLHPKALQSLSPLNVCPTGHVHLPPGHAHTSLIDPCPHADARTTIKASAVPQLDDQKENILKSTVNSSYNDHFRAFFQRASHFEQAVESELS